MCAIILISSWKWEPCTHSHKIPDNKKARNIRSTSNPDNYHSEYGGTEWKTFIMKKCVSRWTSPSLGILRDTNPLLILVEAQCEGVCKSCRAGGAAGRGAFYFHDMACATMTPSYHSHMSGTEPYASRDSCSNRRFAQL